MKQKEQIQRLLDKDLYNLKRIRANGGSSGIEMYCLGRIDAFATVLIGGKPKAARTIKRPRPAKPMSGMCDANESGCSCNQSASVGHEYR